ncbi:Cyclic di-GMP phosphodiesterase response regulator RpfG [compost metagenome]
MANMLILREMNELMEKDIATYEHSLRVQALAKAMAPQLQLSYEQQAIFVSGCFLHDIGKSLVPIEILNKSSALNPQEWEIMKHHSSLGALILRDYPQIDPDIISVVELHHERWNGKGYPHGLKGEAIPIFARVCAIIDSFDCMISDRPYRKGCTVKEAKCELLKHAGSQFDPFYVNLFIQTFGL